MAIYAKCDDCANEWYIHTFDYNYVGDGVTRVSFCCPACSCVYLISCTDERTERQKKKIRKLLTIKRSKKENEELEKIRRELKDHEKRLKDKYA